MGSPVTAMLPALHGVTHLENEAVDLAGGLQITRTAVAQKPPQDPVVTFEQFGKDDAPLRLFDDERAELGHDQPLVRSQILFYNGNQHCRITFKSGFKITFFHRKKQNIMPFFKIIGQSVGYPENIHILCIPIFRKIQASYFDRKFAM